MSAEDVSKLVFTDPPVVSVSLTVFFEPVENLQASHLSSLRERWKGHYPNTAELPPLRPRNRGGNEASLVPISTWPCPYLTFSTEDDQSSVAIQSDRFIRSWSFQDEENLTTPYPGYEQIRKNLVEHLDEFRETVRSELGHELVLTGSECDYVNLLDKGHSAEQLIVGLATKWSAPISVEPSPAVGYGGVRIHLEGEPDGASVVIRLDAEADEGPMLGIESGYELADEGKDADLELGGLDRAHQKLIATFAEYTSEEMQKKWGRTA